MTEYSYCEVCGSKNASSLIKCTICSCDLPSAPRQNPINSSQFRSSPLAVFDIDKTILDSSQRFKDAQRAGLVDKDGNAVKKSKVETMGKAMKRRNDFLYSPDNMRKDKVINGASALIDDLVKKGYTIAYLTARPFSFHTETINQLEDKGFPIFRDNQDVMLVISKGKLGQSTPNYKAEKLLELSAKYDVRMFFDDDKDILSAVGSHPMLDIPGLYLSIRDYRQYSSKSNPVIDSYAKEYAYEEPTLSNPPVKPRRKKMSNGKYRKEPAKKYVDRFMSDSKMTQEFPDNGQRYAVCLTYVEKFYGKSGLDSVGARRNPEEYQEDYMVPRDIHRLGKAADRLESTYEEGQEVPEWWKSKLSVAAKDTDTLADALEYVDERGNPGEDALTVFTGEPNGQFENKGMVTAEVQIGRGIMKDIGEGIQDIYRGIVGGRQSMTEKRMAIAVATMHKELSDRAKAKGANAVANLQIDYEYPTQGDLTLMATADAIKMSSPPKQNPLPLMGLSVQVSGHRNAAGAFVMKGKKFLILQRSTKETSKHGLWELPGGKVEKGETPRETAVIEVKEEAGLDIKLKANLGPHHDDKMKKTYHAYVAVPKKGQRVKLSEEHSDYKWVTPEEVMAMPNKMVSHHLLYFLKKEGETIRSNPFFNKKTWTYTDNLGTNATVISGKVPTVFGEPEDAMVSMDKKRLVIQYRGANRPTEASITLPDGSVKTQKGLIRSVSIYPKEKPPHAEINQENDSGYQDYLLAKALEAETEEEREDYYEQARLVNEGIWDDMLGGETPEEIMEGLDRGPEFYLNNPRSNPPKKKIEKGKKLYKHMNGKDPEKIETKKIDMGDVWYQVGEGGCWQIGYMSGKETGSSSQKYTHTFNEETKDGNFPKLYATMPENGKPMLIITGGTWKIKTDDTGTAWIYD